MRTVEITYKNWRGEVSKRVITPDTIWFGITDHHSDHLQHFLSAHCHVTGAKRDFAMHDILEWKEVALDMTVPSTEETV